MLKPIAPAVYTGLAALAVVLPIAALILFFPKDETQAAAPEPTTVVTEAPAPSEPDAPAPEPTTAPVPKPAAEPEPSEPDDTSAPDASLPTLADAIRDAYPDAPDPGILFFEGEWTTWTPAADERVGEPGVYAGIVGRTTQKVVKFDGGTAIIAPGNFDGFTNTTQLNITVTP